MIVTAYALQIGYDVKEKEKFQRDLEELMDIMPMEERVVIGADFNEHVGEENQGDEEVIRRNMSW